ncbi:MAG: hypothetical protein PHX38_09385 [Sulfuricella sp.]|nr:hypothetical protein [Sulfuricella sp.]
MTWQIVETNSSKTLIEDGVDFVLVSDIEQGPPGPPGTGSGDMQKLIYDPHGFEIDIFDLGHMTGTLDAGTF